MPANYHARPPRLPPPIPCATSRGTLIAHLRASRRDRLTICGAIAARNLHNIEGRHFCRACQRQANPKVYA